MKSYTKRTPFDHYWIKNYLTSPIGKEIVESLAKEIGMNSYSFEILEEVTTYSGRKIDSVILFKGMEEISVGIELKNHYSDLKADQKIEEYLGTTDYFFLWARDSGSLRRLAEERFNSVPEIGLIFQSRKRGLQKMAVRQDVEPLHRISEKSIQRGRNNRAKRLDYRKIKYIE